jgi:hypothetical protein
LIGWISNSTHQYRVYRNDLPAKNWIRVRPIGLPGNKGAAGAKIRLFETGTANLLWFEEVHTYCKQVQQSYGYAYAQTERHYGLGARTNADVEVEFYPSGTKVKKSGAANNKTWFINENGATGEVAVDAKRVSSAAADLGMRLTAEPNPFVPVTTLRYSLSGRPSQVKLDIYDPSGKRVASLVSRNEGPGMHAAAWNAVNSVAGVYFARLQVGGKVLTRTIILAK